jgi:TonB family protein
MRSAIAISAILLLPALVVAQRTPGHDKSEVGAELMTGSNGIDFKPYLNEVASKVRAQWFEVWPKAANAGPERRVVIEAGVDRDGTVVKLVIASASGLQPLDRAAVAAISAVLPLPPIPADFRGDRVNVQFTFVYRAE